MGVVRGDFEKVLQVQQGPRSAQISTDVPDVGAPLRLLAPAFKSWADLFGKLAGMGTDYTKRKNSAEREMYETDAMSAVANTTLARVEQSGRYFDERRKAGEWNSADEIAYAKWQADLDAAQHEANKMSAKSTLARDRWRRTGFFGFRGTPTINGDGMMDN